MINTEKEMKLCPIVPSKNLHIWSKLIKILKPRNLINLFMNTNTFVKFPLNLKIPKKVSSPVEVGLKV